MKEYYIHYDISKPISNHITRIFSIFDFEEIKVKIAGGAVRDIILGKTPKDIDFAIECNPDKIIEILEKHNIHYITVGLKHGTVTAIIDNIPYEITSLRNDVETDGRHAIVEFNATWEQDANRRDLTINSLYISKYTDGEICIHDYVGGMDDITNKVIKITGNPEQRIQEDYLRILRFFRFYSQLDGFNIDSASFMACVKYKDQLKTISVERIRDELLKTLKGSNWKYVIQLMNVFKILPFQHYNYSAENFIDFIDDNADPICKLILFTDNKSINYLSELKLSIYQQELLSIAVDFWNNCIDYESGMLLSFSVQYNYICNRIHIKKYDIDMLKIILNSFNSPLINLVDIITSKKCPVNGNDFIKLGYSGVSIGVQLNAAKHNWIKSNFIATKEELLKV